MVNYYSSIVRIAFVSLGLLILLSFTLPQSSSSLSSVINPFTNSNAKIENITKSTSDAKYDIVLQYSAELLKKGEPSFFMVNMFSNNGSEQIRLRHVDCDLIILRGANELYRLSNQYGEPQFHSINGVMLASFPFTEVGMYTISIKITGEYFIPIRPVYANFSGTVTHTSDGNLKITIT